MSAGEPRCEDAIVFLPGLLGSSLIDANRKVVWGFSPRLLAQAIISGKPLDRLRLPTDGSPDGIEAGRVLAEGQAAMLPELLGVSPYTKLLRALRHDIALHPAAVMEAPYDWRRSIADTALALRDRIERHLESWRGHAKGSREAKLTLVGHSMGGLVARYYVEVLGADSEVSRVLTLGTPHYGSVKALLALHHGRVLKLGAHHTHVRDLVRTLPSVYELAPSYRCVGAKGGPARKLEPVDIEALGGCPRLARAARAVQEELERSSTRTVKTEYHVLRGISQATLQGLTVNGSDVSFHHELEGIDEQGDGTVYRRAAVHRGTTPSPLSQKHHQLAASAEAIAFVKDMLLGTGGPPLGRTELGLDAPELVNAGHEFAIDVTAVEPADVGCRVLDMDTGALVIERAVAAGGDEPAKVRLTVWHPGLYQIEAKAGGAHPVSDMLLVV
jgi:pimeloyl-ACP methyl ester carboxylesterase